MVGVHEDLIVPLNGVDIRQMLEFWRWLIPETHSPLFATALGDLFLTNPDGQVLWLDMGVGSCNRLPIILRNSVDWPRTLRTAPFGSGKSWSTNC